MDHKEIRGLISAVVTPFKADGGIDYKSFEHHVARVASAKGIYGIAVSGHAGEVLTLTSEERIGIVAAAKKVMPKGVKLVAGIASGSMVGWCMRDRSPNRRARKCCWCCRSLMCGRIAICVSTLNRCMACSSAWIAK